MISRQAALATLLLRTGIIDLLPARRERRLSILAYHRILDDDADPRLVADPGLFSATTSDFDRQMAFVARHFNVTTFAELAHGVPMPDKPLIITFDDGFEDNYSLAWPILRKHGLKAVFFIATDFIEQGEPLWFDRAACQIASSGLPEELDPGEELQTSIGAKLPSPVQHALSRLKLMSGDARREAVERLIAQTGEALDIQPARPMTWDQLREMSDGGMEIGSHSCSHTVLASEDRETIFRELGESREVIESRVGKPCVSLAYPVGGKSAVDQEVIQVAGQCGYRYACNYLNGVNPLPLSGPLNLFRQHVETDVSFTLFIAQLALPRLFGYGQA